MLEGNIVLKLGSLSQLVWPTMSHTLEKVWCFTHWDAARCVVDPQYTRKVFAHSLLNFSSLSFRFFMIILLVTSTWPFAWGWPGKEKWLEMTRSEQNNLNLSLLNCFALSKTITLWIPNRQMIFFQTKLRCFFQWFWQEVPLLSIL